MSTAVAKAERTADLAPVHTPSRGATIVADALVQETEQRKLLGQYVAHHMVEGVDYGVIPGTKNKTLLKPGAEKLTQLFRCIPRFTTEDKVENWETGLFYYRFRCQIVTQADDAVVAEGVGSCSTYESRYRWREAGRRCPECGKEAIIRGKKEYGGGWLCFGKKGGCGAKFGDDDAGITGQQTGRVQNPDLIDSVNTVLKMAKKRALVDAAIALARCSDIFTQDLDDAAEPEPAPPVRQLPAKDMPTLREIHAEAVRGAATADALKAAVGRINADVEAKRLGKADTDYLTPLVLARKAELAQPTPASPELFNGGGKPSSNLPD